MVQTAAILPRPSISAPCTCIWAALDEQREDRADDQHEHEQSTFSQVKHTLNPLNAISSIPLFGNKSDNAAEDVSISPEDLPHTSPRSPVRDESRATLPPHVGASAGRKSNKVAIANRPDRIPIIVDPKFGTIRSDSTESRATVSRMEAKAEILKKSGWLGKARPFKLLGKAPEVKVGELISYREDLVYILDSLIPSRRLHDQHSTHPPSVLPVPHTPLCPTCQQNLAYSLFNTPAAHNTFVRESATSAFLALLDDATASLKGSLPLEHITHHQLDSILRRELAVVEWRVAANLAKFHKKTGFLKEFPVRLGKRAHHSPFTLNTAVTQSRTSSNSTSLPFRRIWAIPGQRQTPRRTRRHRQEGRQQAQERRRLGIRRSFGRSAGSLRRQRGQLNQSNHIEEAPRIR
ncbi:uncharacterized protein EV422DRAFT_547501 [Fimicolochytrium jonesii]|uniref:uncharacterized protein n=1 Tax=Fimicolochytrium jonesii TaxID=1396493 RepID=UPI0022FDF75E|nr:uncharacterized protein EV422DRAFT_547501 [Fimicolochytrium jonesii]KAI8816020.1 hypothetical protein EV422DRAFT_547501 [Fimicolochytrium jonesii]